MNASCVLILASSLAAMRTVPDGNGVEEVRPPYWAVSLHIHQQMDSKWTVDGQQMSRNLRPPESFPPIIKPLSVLLVTETQWLN